MNRFAVFAAIALSACPALGEELIVTPESFWRGNGTATIIVNVFNPLDRRINLAFFECWSMDKTGKTIELQTGLAKNIGPQSAIKARVSFANDVARVTDGACRFVSLSNKDRR